MIRTDPTQSSIESMRPVIDSQIATAQAEFHRANPLQPILDSGPFGPHNLSNSHAHDHLTYSAVLDPHGVQARDTFDQEQAISHAEYQILITEYPDFPGIDTCSQEALLKFIKCGMDYLEASLPCLHRLTFTVSAVPVLSLALCSLGMALSTTSEVEKIGQMLTRMCQSA
jgi:hypothetical protein